MHTTKGTGKAYWNSEWAGFSFTFSPYESIPLVSQEHITQRYSIGSGVRKLGF